jgi:hypothetical protein
MGTAQAISAALGGIEKRQDDWPSDGRPCAPLRVASGPSPQPGVRAGYGVAWGKRLGEGRRATGLAANGNSASGNVHKGADGHVEAHIHVHGNTQKTTLKARGAIEAKLHRWPVMSDVA